jgi:hypothetical protein
MSASTVYAGLAERFATVSGIKQLGLGEPTSIHDLPALYSAYEGFERGQAGQITTMTHRFVHRLVIRWQEFAQAEAQLLTFIHAIPAAIDADPKLGGRIPSGLARITGAAGGFTTIGKTKYRVVDFTSEVLEKAPFQSGI